jgi:2-polyprenyl-3-methyl-5-hydroxy-6-metoxy-1,4-benzoquinol methylase
LEMQCTPYLPGRPIIYEDYKIHLSRYVFASKYVSDVNVLDVACASGYGSSYLLRKGAKSVIGADINEECVKLAGDNFTGTGLTFQVADAKFLPFADSSFDVVTSMGTLDHLDKPDAFLAGAVRVLRNGGHFICSIRNREAITPFPLKKSVSDYHNIEYSPLELAGLLSKYFGGVKVYGQKYANKR